MKKAINIIIVSILLFLPYITSAQSTYSIQPVGEAVGLKKASFSDIFTNAARWILGFLSLAAVVMIIIGGIMWMSSAGNEEKVAKAKQILTSSVIGLIIVLLSWAIVIFVTGTFSNVTR